LKQYQQYNEQRIAELENRLIENQIKSQYPDFDAVVNNDTIGMLKDADPELVESLVANPNMYSKAVAVYKSIKRYGLAGPGHEDVPANKAREYAKAKEKVSNNMSKPRTLSSISPQRGDSPLSRTNAFAEGLTDEIKAQTWKEMQDIVNNG